MSATFPTLSSDNSLRLISIEQAVEMTRQGQVLQNVEIADLRAILEALAQLPQAATLRCANGRIHAAECAGLLVPVAIELRSVVFLQPASFAYTTFARFVEIGNSTFRQDAIFASAQFQGRARFTGTTFAGGTSFQGAQFDQEADFERTRFEQIVPFDFARFRGGANFHEVRFSQTATFCMAGFRRAATFRGSTFDDLLNFRGATFESGARLNLCNVHLRPGAQILLTIQQIGLYQRPGLWWLFGGRHGPGQRFLLRRAMRLHERLQQRWPSMRLIDGEDSDDPAKLLGAAEQYNMLRDNFRTLPGREREEDRCHYKYKDLLRRGTRGHPIWRFLDWAIYKWCLGYGIFTRRILLTGIAAILLFAAWYWPLASHATVRNFDGNFNALYFSVITFTTIGYGDYAPLSWLRIPAGLEGLTGLVLMSVFTVSFARKLIR